jgi:hypothetical protein
MGDGRFMGFTVMQWGPIPPSGGPHRLRYLDANGRLALQAAHAEYAAAVALLGDAAGRVPQPYPLDAEVARDAFIPAQRRARDDWNAVAATLDASMLAEVEPHIQRSEAAAVAALNFLEDHELRDEAHTAIHRSGFLRSGLYGCPIHFRDDDYRTECLTVLAHQRFGASAGLVTEFECSICGRQVEDCDHLGDEFYEVIAAHADGGRCSVCDSEECEHEMGQVYEARAYARAKNFIAQEISWVARPRYPLARLREQSFDVGSLADDPGTRTHAERGELHCDGCVGPCPGFNEMTNWELDRSTQPPSRDRQRAKEQKM